MSLAPRRTQVAGIPGPPACRRLPVEGAFVVAGAHDGRVFAPHLHACYEVTLVGREGASARCGRQIFLLAPGDVVVIGPGIPHVLGPVGRDSWETASVYLPALPADAAVRHAPGHVVTRDGPLGDALRRVLDGDLATADELKAAVTELRARAVGALGAPGPRPALPGVRLACEYVDAHAHESVHLPALARLAGLSLFHFIRAFTALAGLPPYAYLIQRRVMLAQDYLASGLTTTATARRCGFADQSHLSRHFKRVLGVTPARFRSAPRAGGPLGA